MLAILAEGSQTRSDVFIWSGAAAGENLAALADALG
jgi:hypothetical protein